MSHFAGNPFFTIQNGFVRTKNRNGNKMSDIAHLVNALAILYGEEPVEEMEMKKQPVEIELPEWNPASPPSSPQTVGSEGYDPETDGEFSDTESDDGEEEVYRTTMEEILRPQTWDEWLDEHYPDWEMTIKVCLSLQKSRLVINMPVDIFDSMEFAMRRDLVDFVRGHYYVTSVEVVPYWKN